LRLAPDVQPLLTGQPHNGWLDNGCSAANAKDVCLANNCRPNAPVSSPQRKGRIDEKTTVKRLEGTQQRIGRRERLDGNE
jgi:hypothetical protein